MLKIFVDSGSSIKQEEKEKYGVEIIPLRYLMGDEEYQDGIDLSIEHFYEKLINEKLFPKTSLPYLDELEKRVTAYTENGDDVIIISISSGISGTFNAFKALFAENKKVRVIDSLTAVGGIRILVEEANKMKDKPLDEIVEKLSTLIPKIKVQAIPENLDYLCKGGRLSKKEWLLGSILNIKPIISLSGGENGGNVKVDAKKIGLKAAMKFIVEELEKNCDENYSIVPSYTYDDSNLKKLIEMTNKKFHKQMIEFDNLDPVIACHWGPNAFGYIYVTKE